LHMWHGVVYCQFTTHYTMGSRPPAPTNGSKLQAVYRLGDKPELKMGIMSRPYLYHQAGPSASSPLYTQDIEGNRTTNKSLKLSLLSLNLNPETLHSLNLSSAYHHFQWIRDQIGRGIGRA
jgi:hypothetical protein